MRNREDPSSRADDPGRALADLAPPIPPERLARVAPILAELHRATRRSLDRDLSLVEPAFELRPDGK